MPKEPRPKPSKKAAEAALAFVLIVDIADFSLQPTVAQPAMLESLKTKVEELELYRRLVASHQVAKLAAGDSLILIFKQSNRDSVDLGTEIQSAFENADSFHVRLGLHFGAVERTVDAAGHDNYVGEAINTCSRVVGFAAHGEFLVTEEARKVLVELGLGSDETVEIELETAKHGQLLHLHKVLNKNAITSEERTHPFFERLAERLRKRASRRPIARLATTEAIVERLIEIRRDAIFGVVLLVVAFGIHHSIENSDAGQRIELAAYDWLLGFVNPTPGDLPVTVVDFKENINVPAQGLDGPKTDLNKLKTVLDSLLSHHPCSVAVDLNFGPQSRAEDPNALVYIDDYQKDDDSIELWLARQQEQLGVPIHLATTLPNPGSRALLFHQEVLDMAAHCFVPSDARTGEIFMFGPIVNDQGELKGISQALSDDYLAAHSIKPSRPTWYRTSHDHEELAAADRTLDPKKEPPIKIESEEFFVNYADQAAMNQGVITVTPSDRFVSTQNSTLSPSDLDERIRGKAVIIGSTTTEGDVFREPRTDEDLSGLMLLAMAADTRIRAPLYEFTPAGRIFLHFFTGLLILGTILGIRAKYLTEQKNIAASRLSLAMTVLVAGGTLLAGIVLVRYTRTIWTDFFLVVFLLLLHPRIEHTIEHGGAALRSVVAKAWRNLLFNKDSAR